MGAYSDIINHYGLPAQRRKLIEEAYELAEAVQEWQDTPIFDEHGEENDKEPLIEHITEEIADVNVMLQQYIEYFDLDPLRIMEIMAHKLDRTHERIKRECNISNRG